MRAQIRSGISGLTGSRPATALPVLGDDTRRILGVREDSDSDSAIEDPNTESLKARPRSAQVPPPGSEMLQPQVFAVSVPSLSPPTKMKSSEEPQGRVERERVVPGISQLRASRSPVRALFQDTARTLSRSSTLVDAESLQESSYREQQSKSSWIPQPVQY